MTLWAEEMLVNPACKARISETRNRADIICGNTRWEKILVNVSRGPFRTKILKLREVSSTQGRELEIPISAKTEFPRENVLDRTPGFRVISQILIRKHCDAKRLRDTKRASMIRPFGVFIALNIGSSSTSARPLRLLQKSLNDQASTRQQRRRVRMQVVVSSGAQQAPQSL